MYHKREIAATIKMEGVEALDLPITIRLNPNWIDNHGMDAWELLVAGDRIVTGPTPGYVLDKSMPHLRGMQDDELGHMVEVAERKAGWDRNP